MHSVGGVYAAGICRLRSTSSFCFFFSLPIDSSVPSLAPHCGAVGKWEYLFSQQMASSTGPRGSVSHRLYPGQNCRPRQASCSQYLGPAHVGHQGAPHRLGDSGAGAHFGKLCSSGWCEVPPPSLPRYSQGSEKEQPQDSAPEEQWGTVLLHHSKAGACGCRHSLPVLSVPYAQWSPCPSPNLAHVLCSTLLQSSAVSWLFPLSVGVPYSPGDVLPLGLHSDLDLWFFCLAELKKLTPSISLQA